MKRVRISRLQYLALCLCILIGCTAKEGGTGDAYLLRIGERVLTVREFEDAFEIAKTAYSHNALQDPNVLREARLRFRVEMADEMVFSERAGALGIAISDEELEEAEAKIRADYPDETFEQSLLESAISYSLWKDRLRARLLVEKVVREDLQAGIKISPEDIREYYMADSAEGVPDPSVPGESLEISEATIRDLRRRKAEAAYGEWLGKLKEQYKVEVNEAKWEEISGR